MVGVYVKCLACFSNCVLFHNKDSQETEFTVSFGTSREVVINVSEKEYKHILLAILLI